MDAQPAQAQNERARCLGSSLIRPRRVDRLDPDGGHLEDIANLSKLGLRRRCADHLPRRETAGGRLGRTVQLQAEAAACSL